ncbi:hypothetical protein [Streptomyces naphthomycinicus]|uniref:hypothetical protein n=1 Tax=Streptomyces naphthomycinicus TaxID=2872625 RepID=UPI001CED6B72|nr:hypothetical protein [Streptomyces sp. TML10]
MGSSTTGFLGPIVGGVLVALVTFWTTRQKARAEVRKLDAEAERTRAETSRILTEIGVDRTARRSLDNLPKGWAADGPAVEDYDFGVDAEVFCTGHASSFIRSHRNPKGFATLAQSIRADSYRGTRLRISAMIKTRDVLGWSGLWMRIDGEDDRTLGFDNMYDRRITGTTGWNVYSVVLDVPPHSADISFGVLLDGDGRVWIDHVKFEVVSDAVAVTERRLPSLPANLDFSAGVE